MMYWGIYVLILHVLLISLLPIQRRHADFPKLFPFIEDHTKIKRISFEKDAISTHVILLPRSALKLGKLKYH